MYKLQILNVPPVLLNWCASFLQDRQQRVNWVFSNRSGRESMLEYPKGLNWGHYFFLWWSMISPRSCQCISMSMTQCCNESSHWLGLESTRVVAIFSDSTRVQYEKWLDSSQQPQMTRLDSSQQPQMTRLESTAPNDSTRLESTAPNDSTRTRLADFAVNVSTQLQLVQNKFIKSIVIVLLGKNNEPCEQWELRNFTEKIYGICIEYIPDGHAYILHFCF
jgi:hypothetical protein